MNYIEKFNAEILEMKLSGAPKLEIQKKQQELDALIERDAHDLQNDKFNFLYWN
jgi:hypothetical protein